MRLVKPSLIYKQAYRDALDESKNESSDTKLNQPEENQSFEDFVQKLNDNAKGENLPDGWVRASMFWLVDNYEVIGRVQIRHNLNEYLSQYGGHIGYYIKPSKRRRGYGKKILELALKEVKKLGIKRVLVTCDDDNSGSKRIIEAHGGILENKRDKEKGEPLVFRYWIEIT